MRVGLTRFLDEKNPIRLEDPSDGRVELEEVNPRGGEADVNEVKGGVGAEKEGEKRKGDERDDRREGRGGGVAEANKGRPFSRLQI